TPTAGGRVDGGRVVGGRKFGGESRAGLPDRHGHGLKLGLGVRLGDGACLGDGGRFGVAVDDGQLRGGGRQTQGRGVLGGREFRGRDRGPASGLVVEDLCALRMVVSGVRRLGGDDGRIVGDRVDFGARELRRGLPN